jgi:hypothetical protein
MNKNGSQKISDYEKRDVNIKKIAFWGIAGVVIVVIILVALVQYFFLVKEDYYFEMVQKPRSEDLMKLRSRETEELNSYKLLDKDKGVYRIPVRRAMELIVEEELTGNINKE